MGKSASKTPQLLKNFDSDIKKIDINEDHGAILNSEGDLYTWGDNKYGQLGILEPVTKQPIKSSDTVRKVTYFKERDIKLVDVVCGKRHTIALDSEGRVFSWGKGKLFRYSFLSYFYPKAQALGHEVAKNLFLPKPIKTLKDEKII